MTLLIAWLVFPLVLTALCVGCGLLLDAIAGGCIPGPLVPGAGLAAIIVVAQVPTLWAATAAVSTPLAMALAVAGFATSRRWRTRGEISWPVVAAVAVFAVYAAPIVLSGQATFAGYIRLDDTATWMALTDRVMDHGRSLAGLPPSSYEATLAFNLGAGYPIGVFLPLGIARVLVGQDLAWIVQPYLAFCTALLALALWELAGPVIRSRALRAAVAFVAAQTALLFGYYLWGGIKEAAGATLVATIGGLAPVVVRERYSLRSLAPLAVTCAALIGVLSGGGAIWLVPLLVPLAVVAVLRLGPVPGLVRAGLFAGATAALCVPVLAPGGALPPTSAPLTSSSALGNLGHPLSKLQLFGIWPAGDFRMDPTDPGLAYALIAVAGAAALLGLHCAWRRRAGALPLYALGALVACGVIVAAGSPWVEAKAMAIAAPAIVVLAMVGGGGLLLGAATRARVPLRIVGAGLLIAVAGGVLWSNALAYRDVNLAPRDQLAELETIGGRIAGQGPTLMTEYQPYGVRHFLRDAAPEGASELRRRVVPLIGGGSLPKGQTADTDRFRLGAILTYRTLVLRRSPFQSRPPAPYRLIWRGHYYEVWQRPSSAPGHLTAHLGLGRGVEPAAVPRCRQVHRLAREAGRGGELVAAARERIETIHPSATKHPNAWQWAGYPGSLLPTKAGAIRAVARIRRPGDYDVWLGGSVRPQVDLEVDGEPAGEVRHQLNNEGEYVQLGSVRLARGAHTLKVNFHGADLHPGSGGAPSPIGPLVLSRQDPADERVAHLGTGEAPHLCGKRWDWIEAVRR
jgi:hypothetical protein